MNQFNESGGDDQSEDGQWRSAEDDISHEEEGDTADSLDIKPPQANRTENRYKEKKSKEKKHSRDRRHRERERNTDRDREERRHRHREREERYDNISNRNKNERGEVMRYEQPYREPAPHYRPPYKERGHEKIRDRDKEKNRDRRKDSAEKSENDKVLEELDLRSRLLRNRTKYESEKKPEDRLATEYENKRSDKEYFKYEYENRRDKDADRNEHHYHHGGEYYRDRKQMIELIDSPENYPENVSISHHKKEKERRPVTAEEKEHAARKAKLLEAEREMARRKELAREELEARREMRREREESRRESTVTPPGNVTKKRKISTGEDDEKKKHKSTGDVVTVSDNSDDDENEVESDSSSSRTEEEGEDYEGKENSDGELPSPLSIGELSKTDLRRKTRTRSRSHSRSRSNSEDTRSRSRSTSKSETPRSRSRSRSVSSRQRSKSNSPRYRRRNDHGDEDSPEMNDNHDSSHERERKRNDAEYKSYRHGPEVSDQEEADQDPIKSPEIIEPKEELTPYFPAIQGCRSVEEFQCLNRIEEGTYGVVYRAKDKRTEEIVALKRLKMEKEKEGFPITSLREINTLLKGQHPNIVTVREIVVGSNMDKIFIVMDYVEHDLKSLMETMKHKKQVFLPGEVKCLTQQLLRAVAHLHDNWILHRDLKTSNLLLSHKGILKVGDFGLAREYGSPLKPYTSIVVTLWYRAPELLLCCKEYSIPIDMWSVGCIFAEFLAMAALFPGKSEVDQLNRIFKDLGTPNERIWPGYNELPAVQKMTFTEYPVSNLRKKFSHLTSELGLSLLQGLLTYDPKQRLSAEQAIKSNFFKELPLPIDPAMFPTWPAKSELGSWKPSASPKPPSGGSEFKNLGADDGDQRWGATLMDSRQLAMGPGFSLKF